MPSTYTIVATVIFIIFAFAVSEISRKQWTNINRLLLERPQLPKQARTVLDANIYTKYHTWATKYATKYIKKHPYKCRVFSKDELKQRAEQGLHAAIQIYKPQSIHTDFCIFAIMHLKTQILCGCQNQCKI